MRFKLAKGLIMLGIRRNLEEMLRELGGLWGYVEVLGIFRFILKYKGEEDNGNKGKRRRLGLSKINKRKII